MLTELESVRIRTAALQTPRSRKFLNLPARPTPQAPLSQYYLAERSKSAHSLLNGPSSSFTLEQLAPPEGICVPPRKRPKPGVASEVSACLYTYVVLEYRLRPIAPVIPQAPCLRSLGQFPYAVHTPSHGDADRSTSLTFLSEGFHTFR